MLRAARAMSVASVAIRYRIFRVFIGLFIVGAHFRIEGPVRREMPDGLGEVVVPLWVRQDRLSRSDTSKVAWAAVPEALPAGSAQLRTGVEQAVHLGGCRVRCQLCPDARGVPVKWAPPERVRVVTLINGSYACSMPYRYADGMGIRVRLVEEGAGAIHTRVESVGAAAGGIDHSVQATSSRSGRSGHEHA